MNTVNVPSPVPLAFSAALDRLGTVAMVRLAVVLALFVAAHLARWPLAFAVRVLTAAMCRADLYLTSTLTTTPSTPTPREEVRTDVYAPAA